eukprot:gene1295-1413_t
MPGEFDIAVHSYILRLKLSHEVKIADHQQPRDTSNSDPSPSYAPTQLDHSVDKVHDKIESEDQSSGTVFSNQGPAPYKGDILEDPQLLWTEDVWTSEKEIQAKEKLKQQGDKVSEYWRKKYEEKAGAYWHQFYKRNADHFYKDRHYLHVVFPELLTRADASIDPAHSYHLLEVGCGVGNAVIPLVDFNNNLQVVAMDFAASAIEILKQHPLVRDLHRIEAYVNNLVLDDLPVAPESMDGILCMFVLSALSPRDHPHALKKLFNALKPGGKLFFRDYGRYDEAQLRFKRGSKLDENFYVRQDGTCSFFFSTEDLQLLAQEAGFLVEELQPVLRQYANRQQKKARYRVWMHMKLVKPL